MRCWLAKFIALYIGLFSKLFVPYHLGEDIPSLLPSISGCSRKRIPEHRLSRCLQTFIALYIGLFSKPVSADPYKQRAPEAFCGAKSFLIILASILPSVNPFEPSKSPYLKACGSKPHIYSNRTVYYWFYAI